MTPQFSEKMEELIAQKATDFQVSKLFKEEIAAYMSSLEQPFQSMGGKGFLVHHTRNIEQIVSAIYRYVLRESFGIYMPSVNAIPVTLVALGSFGREQLCVHSDIDIMFLYKEVKGFHVKPLIERVLYLAWDAGLKLGHRVHQPEELVEAARSDITIRTSLMEGRMFFGSRFLWTEAENVLHRIRMEEREAFIRAKVDEMEERHKKKPISMEPDLKDGVGSLRDANTLFWAANALFGITSNNQLVGKLVAEEEYKEYRIALEHLFRVRSALHLLAGKKKDVLTFDYQADVARMLGMENTKTRKAEQLLIRKTLHALHTIYHFSRVHLTRILRPFFADLSRVGPLRKGRIAPGFYLYEGVLHVSFRTARPTLERMLELLLSVPEGTLLDPSVVLWASHAKLPDRFNAAHKKLLRSLYDRGDAATLVTLFYDAQLIERLIPPMKQILFLAQFDGYHQRAVDLHSIETLRKLETITDPNVRKIYDTLSPENRRLLKMVALLHDAGKGRTKDHSEVGATLFKSYGETLGLEDAFIERGRHLIRYHTLMSVTAQKEDILSDKVLFRFASRFPDETAIAMLYVLTYADMSAVAKGVYNAFTANLLKDLYYRSVECVGKTELVSEASQRMRREMAMTRNEEFQGLPRTLQRKILSIESTLFFLKHKPEEIVRMGKMADETDRYSYAYENEERFAISVISKKPFNLGWFLSKFTFLNLRSMDIFKLFGGAKYFRMEFDETVEQDDLFLLEELIEKAFDMERKVNYEKPVIRPGEIAVDCEHSRSYARMTLQTRDQKGLMAFVIEVFDSLEIDIATAKIASVKKRTRDLFLIEKNGKFCDNQAFIQERLTEGSK